MKRKKPHPGFELGSLILFLVMIIIMVNVPEGVCELKVKELKVLRSNYLKFVHSRIIFWKNMVNFDLTMSAVECCFFFLTVNIKNWS